MMKTKNHTLPDRSPPGSTKTAPSAGHQDRGVKCATGASSKIRGRDNITIGTWNTRTLRPAGKLQELTHEMDRYRLNILGLYEMKWKNFGETITEEGHKVFFIGKEDKHEHSGGFLVHKDIVNTVKVFRPVSSRLITIRLKAVPFNITIVQVHAPMSDYDQLQNVIDQTPKKDILLVQGDWNANVEKDAYDNWKGICAPFCNDDTIERALRLLVKDGPGIAQMDNTTIRSSQNTKDSSLTSKN